MAEPIRVLFRCTANAARSQMAEALLRDKAGRSVETFSAGTHPGQVHPLTIEVLAEVGVDITGARSKSMTEYLGQPFDEVITVCQSACEACPTFPGARRMRHWDVDDPAAVETEEGQRMAAFRTARNVIDARVAE
ncbi:MAG: arsenate reductase ArsC, partial [Candidatus Limnocylindrales bacterium]